MNKSLFIASFAMVSVMVLGMPSDENNRKGYHDFLYTPYSKQTWRITDSQGGTEEKNSGQEIMNFLQDICHKTAEKDSEIAELKNQKTELKDSLKELKDENIKVKKNLFAEKVSQAKPNNEIKALREKNDKLKKTCECYKKKLKKEQRENEKLKCEMVSNGKSDRKFIKKLQEELTQKQLSEDQLKTENKGLKNQIEFLESNKRKENTETTTELLEEIKDLQNQLKDKVIELKHLEEDNRRKSIELEQTMEILEQMKSIAKDFVLEFGYFLNKKGTDSENESESQATPILHQLIMK